MKLFSKKTLHFTRPSDDPNHPDWEDLRKYPHGFQIGFGETKEVPDWVRSNKLFEWAMMDGDLVIVEPESWATTRAVSKEDLLRYPPSPDDNGDLRIAVPRAELVAWMAREQKITPWNVNLASLHFACEELAKESGGLAVQISYKETKFVELPEEEQEIWYRGGQLGTGADTFQIFAAGYLNEKAYENAEIWRTLATEFESLAEKLSRLGRVGGGEPLLDARRGQGSLVWDYSGLGKEAYLQDFSELGVRAGAAHGCPNTIGPLQYWLDAVREYLAATGSRILFPQGQEHGIIKSVAEGSRNYCLWLSRKAREYQRAMHSGVEFNNLRIVQDESRSFATVPVTTIQDIEAALERGDRKGAVELWRQIRKDLGKDPAKARLYDQAGQDHSDYYKWERGEHKDGSRPDSDIRRALLNP